MTAAREGRYDRFADRERAALEYAASLTRDPHGIDGAAFERLHAHFDEGQIVEISAVAGLFNYFNRFNDALGVPPTR